MRRFAFALGALAMAACVEDLPADDPWPDRHEPVRGMAPLGYVSNNGSDDISVIELATMTEVARMPVGTSPIDPEAPHHLAIDPDAGMIYVGLSNVGLVEGGGLHGSHGGGDLPGYVQRLALADFTPLGTVRVDPNLGDILLTPDGVRVVTTHFDLRRALDALAAGMPAEDGYGALIVIDPDAMERTGRTAICTAPHGAVVLGDTAVVACWGEDAVAFVDIAGSTPEVTARVPVGPSPGNVASVRYGPYSITVAPDGSWAYVGALEGMSLRVLDLEARTFDDARAIPLDGSVYFGAFSPDGATFWAPIQTRDGVVRIDTATGAVAQTRFFAGDECVAPHEITYVAALDRIVVVCEDDHVDPGQVLALDPTTLATTGMTRVGVYPDALRVVDTVDW